TLIAIFRLNGGENSVGQIKRLYGLVPGDEDIDKLSPLLTRSLDTRKIKAMYKGPGASFTPTYTTFADRFRKRLGIKNVEGQLLLHRTQSAKSLSSLDQLFRDYMLDRPATFENGPRKTVPCVAPRSPPCISITPPLRSYSDRRQQSPRRCRARAAAVGTR
ncbi:hypothetical protein ACGLFO_08765, partial [Corynebacterium hesseae]